MTPEEADIRARLQQHAPYIIAITGGFAGYEALKHAFLPGMATWQSQAMSIVVVALLTTACSVWFQRLLSTQALQAATLAGRLREEERFRALIQQAADVISVIDVDGIFRYVSPLMERLLGYTPEELVGTNVFDLVHPDDRSRTAGAFAALLQAEGPGSGVELLAWHRDGSWRPLEVIGNNMLSDPRVHGIVITARDMSARKHAEDALRRQATHDALTDLPNRVLLQQRLEEALRGTAPESSTLALLLLDLDRFKDINDTLGHQVGDDFLREVSRRLRAAVRAADTVARLGGDEFAVVLPATDEPGARHVAATLIRALDEPIALGDHLLHTAASIGIALHPEHGSDVDTLLRCADVAMYAAKRDHRGAAIYDPVHDEYSLERLALLADLRQALTEDALALHYQPLMSLRDGQIVGVEALLRWTHPSRGAIPPAHFIPLAEQNGAIGALTRWVLDAALRQCAAWSRAGYQLALQINLSMRDVQDPHLPADVAALLQRHGVAPAHLTLEITESALMADPNRARDVLDRLATLGVRLAIDDFGTGYSSLGYLRELPVDEVKIDQSFVRGMEAHTKDAAIVHSVIALGHALGLAVVAEGVETRAAWNLLMALGCDAAQGYYLSRPVSAADLERAYLMAPAPDAAEQPAEARPSLPLLHTTASLATLVEPDTLILPRTITEEVLGLFEREPLRAAVALGEDGVATALVTRQGLFARLSTIYGNGLYRKRAVALVAADEMLVMDVEATVEQAVRQATSRPLERRYDPLVVTAEGRYAGLVAVSHLLNHLNDAAVLRARMSHPLTGLPGAPVLEAEVNARLAAEAPLVVVLAAIDGPARGDAVILMTARLVQGMVAELEDGFAGHIDDVFVILCRPVWTAMVCTRLAARFATALPRHDEPPRTPSAAVEGAAPLRLRTAAVIATEVANPSYLSLVQEASRRVQTTRAEDDLPIMPPDARERACRAAEEQYA